MHAAPEAPGSRVLGIAPGDQIGGRYEIVRVLGVGGTGAVFEARHMTLGRAVAIKLLLPELAANPVVPHRFLQEARTANEVRHKNIVEVMDFGADNGRLYMVMELLHGESLADFLQREAPVSPGRIVRILEPIMGALATAHARGIVHRDVKPQNIFLQHTEGDDEPVPKLIDFGIAKRIVGGDAQLTSTGMILGTPAYMAPEQARADRYVTHAADQYSLGVILYQALTGHIPYEADTYPALLIQIVTQPPTDILRWRPDLDPALARVVMRVLSREASHRYASFADLRAALAPWRHDDAAGARLVSAPPDRASPTQPDGTPPAPPDAITVQRPSPTRAPSELPPPVATTRLGALAALVVALAVAMVGVAVWLAQRPAPARPAVHSVPAPELITLRVDVEPPVAEIALDGVVVGHGHAEVLRPRDGRRLQLRLAAPGYASVSDVLVSSSDARVSRVLVALAPPPPTPAPAVARPPRAVTTAVATPVVQPDAPRPVEAPRRSPDHPRIDPTNPFR